MTLHLDSEVRSRRGNPERGGAHVRGTDRGRPLLYLIAFDPTAGASNGEGFAVTFADSDGQTIVAGRPAGETSSRPLLVPRLVRSGPSSY